MCQVRAYHTELATTCHCMALTAIHDSEIHWTSTWDIANEIHGPYNDTQELPDKGSDPQRGRSMLRARFNFSLPVASELLPLYSSPFTHH